jgi:hypothetical protein
VCLTEHSFSLERSQFRELTVPQFVSQIASSYVSPSSSWPGVAAVLLRNGAHTLFVSCRLLGISECLFITRRHLELSGSPVLTPPEWLCSFQGLGAQSTEIRQTGFR